MTLVVDKAVLGTDDVANYKSIPESALTDGTLQTQVSSAASDKRFVFTQPDKVIYTGKPVSFQLYVWDTAIADANDAQGTGYHLLKTGDDNLTWSTRSDDVSEQIHLTVTEPGTKYLSGSKADSNYTGYIPITAGGQRVISSDINHIESDKSIGSGL